MGVENSAQAKPESLHIGKTISAYSSKTTRPESEHAAHAQGGVSRRDGTRRASLGQRRLVLALAHHVQRIDDVAHDLEAVKHDLALGAGDLLQAGVDVRRSHVHADRLHRFKRFGLEAVAAPAQCALAQLSL
jgi:hypothetical protein